MKSKSITIKGKYNTAVIFNEKVDSTALDQIRRLCDFAPFAESKIRIMSDVHAGAGCTIGTTMTITDKAVPSMVGVDIGCGMRVVTLQATQIDYAQLDEFIRRNIPAGRGVRHELHPLAQQIDLSTLRCARLIRPQLASRSIGTLGGGNHFIEVDRDEDGTLYLVIHTGSRHLGVEVAEYYQQEAYRRLSGCSQRDRRALISDMRAQGRDADIQRALAEMAQKTTTVPREMAYVEEDLFEDYLHDMAITQRFASLNRQAIARQIVEGLGLGITDEFETVHNYIDVERGILRKGAVSAERGERLLIPLNMRDGALLCKGKGNRDWNCSAPHGAGRLLSRSDARSRLSMHDFVSAMQGIYTTSVSRATLDESPMAYKSSYDIMRYIRPTVSVLKRLLPTYNFKSAEK